MKVLIVDDELKARRLLKSLIETQYKSTIETFTADCLLDAVDIIKIESPEIVLLDIKMPEYSGLDIIHFFDINQIKFQIIFTTAFNQYAVEAFKLSAIDYLLKPIDPDELYEALEKARKNLKNNYIATKLKNLEKSFLDLSINKIALEVPRGYMFVSYDDIIYLEADGMYTKIFLKNKANQTICKPIKHFASQLSKTPLFYKPHRSFLINIKYIKEVKKNEGLYIVLENGKSIAVARHKKDEFLKLLETVF